MVLILSSGVFGYIFISGRVEVMGFIDLNSIMKKDVFILLDKLFVCVI